MNKGQLFIVSGPSGSGKDTILNCVLKSHPEIRLSISSITRSMREGEIEGEKYHFISKSEFINGLSNGEFLEHNEYLGNFYGTPKAPVEKAVEDGVDMIVEVDVNGGASIRRLMPEAVSIFIMPPSFEVLKERLSCRGTETIEQIEGRLAEALAEIARANEYDYVVVNDDLIKAANDLSTIILCERLRIDRQKNIIDEVLKNVKSRDWKAHS